LKAAVYRDYGPRKVPISKMSKDRRRLTTKVFVRIHAAAAKRMDYHLMGGTMVLRLMAGLRRPKVLVRRSTRVASGYGSPRIREDLIEQAEPGSRKRVIRPMQEDGLEARARKRIKSTTMSDHDQPGAANHLGRRFEAPGPKRGGRRHDGVRHRQL
jgi:hypothetical protein